MKRRILIIILCCVVLVMIVLCVEHIHLVNEQKKESLLMDVQNCLEQYPDLPEPYVSSVCFYIDEYSSFLIIKVNDVYIAGERTPNGCTSYYLYNDVAIEDSDIAIKSSEDVKRVLGSIKTGLIDYFCDTSVSCSYHKAKGNMLPIWVSPLDDDYVSVNRSGYEDYVEVISRSGNDNNHVTLRWSIAKSDDDVRLYWAVTDCSDYQNGYIRGWGYVPDEIIQVVNAQNGS